MKLFNVLHFHSLSEVANSQQFSQNSIHYKKLLSLITTNVACVVGGFLWQRKLGRKRKNRP
jgi:hypothetical protein